MAYADTPIPLITLLRRAPYWTQHALPLVFATVVSAAKTVRKVLPLSPRETQLGMLDSHWQLESTTCHA
jgi:hypothetical protein